jgi:hypothetical protein
MKKQILVLIAICSLSLFACNNSSSGSSAASVAKEWCDLNGKVHKASTPEEKAKAEEKRREYENKMDEKYKNDTAMQRMIALEVEKCEGASEGR